MNKPQIYDKEGHAQFITFSCYKRRNLLDDNSLKKIVTGVLNHQLTKQAGNCAGFVVMPNHIHAVLWFPVPDQLRHFIKQWKQISSFRIKKELRKNLKAYNSLIGLNDPVWQAGYYAMNIYAEQKLREKINYIHNNPVRAGLIDTPEGWIYSSEQFFSQGKSVGIPIKVPG